MRKMYSIYLLLSLFAADIRFLRAAANESYGLHDAVRAGDLVTTMRLLGCTANKQSCGGLESGHAVFTDVNKLDAQGVSALLCAIASRRDETRAAIVKALIVHGANIKIAGPGGRTALHLATSYGSPDIIKLLLDRGSDPNVLDKNGMSPLHEAAFNGHANAIDMLVRAGANVDSIANDKITPLHLASRYGRLEAVNRLLAAHARIMPDSNGSMPVHYAAYNGRNPVVKALIASDRASAVVTDNEGRTPLHYAVISRRDDVVKFLLSCNVDTLAQDKYGRTSFHYAAYNFDKKVMQLLARKALACLEVRDKQGQTPFEYAKCSMDNQSYDQLQKFLTELKNASHT